MIDEFDRVDVDFDRPTLDGLISVLPSHPAIRGKIERPPARNWHRFRTNAKSALAAIPAATTVPEVKANNAREAFRIMVSPLSAVERITRDDQWARNVARFGATNRGD